MKCQLCEREVQTTEFHHYFPGKKRRKNNDGIDVCKSCGDQIHLMFTNQQLRDYYHDLKSLKAGMNTWLKWIKDKPDKHFCMRKKK